MTWPGASKVLYAESTARQRMVISLPLRASGTGTSFLPESAESLPNGSTMINIYLVETCGFLVHLPGLVNIQKRWKITIFIGKSTINGPFSIAVLNYQRYVHLYFLNASSMPPLWLELPHWHPIMPLFHIQADSSWAAEASQKVQAQALLYGWSWMIFGWLPGWVKQDLLI